MMLNVLDGNRGNGVHPLNPLNPGGRLFNNATPSFKTDRL